MVVIPRGVARSFRAVVRKCRSGRPRPPAAPVLVDASGERLRLSCVLEGAFVSMVVPHAAGEGERFVMPMSVLDEVDGTAVEITVTDKKGTARREGREGPKAMMFETLDLEGLREVPPGPEVRRSVPPAFLSALHECGRTATRDASRYALHRVQVNGKTGSVVATDGKSALICRGFTLPFRETILVPALPVFGSKEVSCETDVHLGRTKDHLVIEAGPWTIHLPIDTTGRFPDVAGVIPKSPDASVVGIDERDAEELLAALPERPDASDGVAAVTLDVEKGVACRARNDETGEVREVRLSRSTWAGPDIRIALDRQHLARTLGLGCLALRLASGQPVVAQGDGRTFIIVTLGDDSIVTPSRSGPENPSNAVIPEPERRMVPMKPEPNGAGPLGQSPNAGDRIDPLAEAEAVRTALAEAVTRAGRLVQCLKQLHRRRKVLNSAWSSLRSLGLGTGGES